MKISEEQNICTVLGFALAIQKTLRLAESGLLYVALPCTSFTWVSKSRHRRSAQKPLGNVRSKWVQQHNLIACRVSILLALCLARKIFWMIEHPRSSIVFQLPWIRALLQLHVPVANITHFHVTWCFG